MKIDYSERLKKLPPYLFAEIDRKKKAAIERGVDIISLGVGDPDLPTPKHIVDAMKIAVEKPKHHQYPFGAGLLDFRKAVSDWYKMRFNVDLNPQNEIHSLIGSKEGIGHIHLAFINPGDIVLVPEPGYPVYNCGTIFSDGMPYFLPLIEKNNFLPDLEKIPEKIAKRAKILFINYPNNPTSATATLEFYERVVRFAEKYNIIVCSDLAYSEIYFDGKKPPSFLEVEGAKNVGVEFHSLSKTYQMTGWRLGWACGNSEIIAGLSEVKDNYDSGVFGAVQEAGAVALTSSQNCVEEMRKVYQNRRDIFTGELNKIGWSVKKPEATFYVWAKVPKGYTSADTVTKLLDEAGIICTPGNGLGPSGEGYVRFALTVSETRLKQAVEKISKIKW
ncbi:MAG: LL-diaminopimelate aminotransferase [Elusimicrobia bacterium CG06_land_8_20_14_3_00_38_11]|nr:MAG: LL-diaminopimelate aminotransferase [Elusimicrobia bacterium CG06_land_8_20_14_3_00_38_11]